MASTYNSDGLLYLLAMTSGGLQPTSDGILLVMACAGRRQRYENMPRCESADIYLRAKPAL